VPRWETDFIAGSSRCRTQICTMIREVDAVHWLSRAGEQPFLDGRVDVYSRHALACMVVDPDTRILLRSSRREQNHAVPRFAAGPQRRKRPRRGLAQPVQR